MSDAAERIARVRKLEESLRGSIRGQDHVLARVASVFTRGELGLTNPARPRGSFLLAGPTGTGKSATFARAVEGALGPGRLVTFDMSEYQHASAVQKLLGENRADPGLLGKVLLNTAAVGVLFDEIEKAHPLVMDLFLQILWDARVTLATGETIRFSNHYIGFTSNLGAQEAMRMERSKFSSVEQAVLRRLEQMLRPELLARTDEKLVFARLTPEVQREIAELHLVNEVSRLKSVGYDVTVSREALEFLVREGFHPHLGARPLRQTIERHLQEAVVKGLFSTGSGSGRVSFDAVSKSLRLLQ